MKYRLPSIAFACLLSCLLANAQTGQYQFSHLDNSGGLSHNQVNAIIKDSKGFMWFGTMSGLNRYDGYNFKIFRHKPGDSTSLNDDFISSILQGPDDKLWLETRSGQNIFDPITEKFTANTAGYLKSLSLPAVVVSEIVKDKHNNYWFLLKQQGLGIYNMTTKKAQWLLNESGKKPVLHNNDIADIGTDNNGSIWIIYRDGLLEKMNETTHAVTARNDFLQQKYAGKLSDYRMFVDAEGDVWIFIYGEPLGTYYFNTSNNSVLHLNRNAAKGRLNNDVLTSIHQDTRGMVWISTDHGGINIVNKKTFDVRYLLNNADDSKALSQNSIYTIYRDNTGIMWVGTFKKGINYYHENFIKFPVYRHQPSDANSLPFDDVNHFVEDDKGNIWMGTNGGGLLYYDRLAGSFRQFRHSPSNSNSLSNDVIVSLYIDSEKKLWIGTYFGGLDCYDGKQFVHYKNNPADPSSISDNRIWEIYEDAQKQLWVGTLAGGLNRFDRAKKIFYHYRSGDPNSIKSDYIPAIIEDKDNNLWIGTAYGISVLDKKTDRFFYFNHDAADTGSISNDNIITLFCDSRGLTWAGTREGLNLYDKSTKKFRHYRIEDGLPSNTVLTILEDNDHALWFSTPNGISKATVTKDANGKIQLQFKNYDERDGLQGREFNENAAYKTRQGELIFGGANGINIINPGAIRHNTVIPKVVLTDFLVFDRPVTAGEKIDKRVLLPKAISEADNITLNYYENVFSLEFAALSFSNPEKNKYAYKLEGFNKEWLTTDGVQRKATYTNLDPGEYTFRVKASNDDGVWNEEGVSLRVRILPPFWKTTPAFIIYAIILAGILFFARRLTIQRARMRFKLEQQKKEADRMHELDMLKLKFFTNVSHEFRTPLSLIIAPAEKMSKQVEDEGLRKQFQLIYRNAKRLLGLVNQLLDFRKLEMQELRLYPSKGDIIRFIKELVYSFTDIAEKKNIRFTFHNTIDSLEVSFDPDKMERIMFNLLSNAFKFTRESGNVDVYIRQKQVNSNGKSEQYVEIKVKDTGIGIPLDQQEKIFERFFQHDVPGSILNQGSGIGLAITKEFVRLHQGSIAVESKPDWGTCFTVLLPVNAPVPVMVTETVSEQTVLHALHEEEMEPSENGKRKKPVILIIDDNDDIRFYLKDNMRASYIIYEADNGKDGWQKALQLQPDLIVSDVMMPDMNGMELCRKIKTEPQTSHIPVILLTARTAEEQKLEGFETGASDYITKPFSIEILQSRIRNLLAQQEAMRKLFQKQIEINPGEISVTSVDEQFIRQALEVVEKNISNTDFSVEDLSRALHMSRVALYKKLLSLTGKPPLEFIRTIRLKRAAQLLEKSQLNISEIAYEVGFNNPKYFARFFRREFNVLPSEYGAARKNKG